MSESTYSFKYNKLDKLNNKLYYYFKDHIILHF